MNDVRPKKYGVKCMKFNATDDAEPKVNAVIKRQTAAALEKDAAGTCVGWGLTDLGGGAATAV